MILRTIPFLASFLTALCALVGVWLGGVYTFLTPAVVFVGLPIMDVLVGHDRAETIPGGEGSHALDNVVRLWAPMQLIVLGVMLVIVTFGSPSPLELAGMLLSTALVSSGGAINAAHELMHRKSKFDRALAEILMSTVSYTHFCIEHVCGHHKNVATPHDPATARIGQSLYSFYPQTVIGSLRSAITIERRRNKRRSVRWLSWRNRLTRYAVILVASWLVVYGIFGASGLLFHLAQGFLAFSLLEVINYIEHYGLQRAEKSPGKYELVQPRHSWNANHRVSNWWLFNLQRHADHHAHAARPYYHLQAVDEGPQLPFSYPTAIIAALVPPVWHALMDHRVGTAAAAPGMGPDRQAATQS